MTDKDLELRAVQLEDVELVRMLTVNSGDFTARALEVARAEANKRGLPIDPAFIPTARPDVPANTGAKFEVAGLEVICSHCAGDTFTVRGETLLNTRSLSFLRLDWLNETATTLVCTRCGLVQFFAPPPSPATERAD